MLIAFQDAFALLTQFDQGVISIVLVSLQVSLSALVLGALVGLPLGAWLATEQLDAPVAHFMRSESMACRAARLCSVFARSYGPSTR
jgi:ABC-type tungstate transport system substrate-binding protein